MAYKLKDLIELTELFPELLEREISELLEEVDQIIKRPLDERNNYKSDKDKLIKGDEPKNLGQKWAEESYPTLFDLPRKNYNEKESQDFFERYCLKKQTSKK